MISEKYGRTYHYPFSPGTTSDDQTNHMHWEDIQRIRTLVYTERLDGENNCLSQWGVFACSHAALTTSPWMGQLRERWELIKNDLDDIEISRENLYAVHSIEYQRLETHFYVFAVRCMGQWLSQEEVKFYAALFDFPTIPELKIEFVSGLTPELLRQEIIRMSQKPAILGSCDPRTKEVCAHEGVVGRNVGEYPASEFTHNVFKYVRKGYVKTDEHWTRNWKRVPLAWEFNNEKEGQR